ncbi:Protein of unknown function DUF92, TMEM19 [Cynara cardunculus var. scolymus]|uniref:Protein VTE6, chloroplastic n=1 Tax=Cynara cardunculus var. scolymus TaxID=59895 RepID=A0A124SF52_CYNCS|nr:Protein of unknown function DUF92, TMEM19 [Cynara cardunculus var. scolymus]
MATTPLTTIPITLSSLTLRRRRCTNFSSFFRPAKKPLICTFTSNLVKASAMESSFSSTRVQSSGGSSVPDLGLVQRAIQLAQLSPPTWQSAIFSNLVIFLLGSPILVTGLSLSGIGAAFLLGTLTWRGFGPSGFLLVATYFIIGTAVTKVKMAQKEAQGVAEKRKGRRGPGSVIGSSAAGCVCALLSIYGVGGKPFSRLWELGFVASFCTKLSDTIKVAEAVICVLASQIANVGESVIGAALQEKEGFKWLNNDAVNVINISLGSMLAILIQQVVLQNWIT